MKRALLRVICVSLLLGASAAAGFCQDDGQYAIRVEAPEVVVPAFVSAKKMGVEWGGPGLIPAEQDVEVPGLTAKDFHIFEDDVEQTITSIRTERLQSWFVRDNVSAHRERLCTPTGIWIGPDIPKSSVQTTSATQRSSLSFYYLSYVPPTSPANSCHRIRVMVGRLKDSEYYKVKVTARDAYCKTDSPSDPLSETNLGKQMEEHAALSPGESAIPLSAQTAVLFGMGGEDLVNVALEFPWKSLKYAWHRGDLYSTIGVVGLIYDKSSKVASRFSDAPCYALEARYSFRCDSCSRESQEYENLPTRYQVQTDLPPGDYRLKIVLTDGTKFGRADVPLRVEAYDRRNLSISDIVLAKRCHHTLSGPSQYVRLVAGEEEFALAADTKFRRGEALFAYFEVDEPLQDSAPGAKVQIRLKVSNAQTGDLKVDTGLEEVSALSRRGKSVIPVAEDIGIDKLAPGSYRLEVQATDSAGRSTQWRTVNFTVE